MYNIIRTGFVRFMQSMTGVTWTYNEKQISLKQKFHLNKLRR